VVFSPETYSKEDAALFRHMAAEEGICVVYTYEFMQMSVVADLAIYDNVRPVVLLLSPEDHMHLLHAMQAMSGKIFHNFFFFLIYLFFFLSRCVSKISQVDCHLWWDGTEHSTLIFLFYITSRSVSKISQCSSHFVV
jgi:hypothetical protein